MNEEMNENHLANKVLIKLENGDFFLVLPPLEVYKWKYNRNIIVQQMKCR